MWSNDPYVSCTCDFDPESGFCDSCLEKRERQRTQAHDRQRWEKWSLQDTVKCALKREPQLPSLVSAIQRWCRACRDRNRFLGMILDKRHREERREASRVLTRYFRGAKDFSRIFPYNLGKARIQDRRGSIKPRDLMLVRSTRRGQRGTFCIPEWGDEVVSRLHPCGEFQELGLRVGRKVYYRTGLPSAKGDGIVTSQPMSLTEKVIQILCISYKLGDRYECIAQVRRRCLIELFRLWRHPNWGEEDTASCILPDELILKIVDHL